MAKKQQGRRRGASARTSSKKFRIRSIGEQDAEKTAELISRLKRLNGEFDPLLRTSDEVEESSLKILKERMTDGDYVILVAESDSKVVGVSKSVMRDRVYYEPRREGAIVELYIMPEFRRGNLGRALFDATVSALKKKGARLITAEFPSQNQIAHRFYTKMGFRSLTNVYARAP